jgi:TPR repeat protein
MYVFGVRYLNGWGVEQNVDKAQSWLKKAGKGGVGIAWRRLGEIYQAANAYFDADLTKKMNDAFRAGAKLKDAECLAHLGYNAMRGIGMKQDEILGEGYYRESLALDPNVGMSLNNLGVLYQTRYRAALEKKQQAVADELKRQMLEYYEKASENGFALAARNLAELYANGALGKVDQRKAYDYFQKAADEGDTEARFRLGEMHEKGLGVPVTPEEAAYHYRLAALDGHVTARRQLVSFYLNGQAGAQDLDRAAFWLELEIRSGETLQLMPYIDIMLKREKYAEAVKVLNDLKDSRDTLVASFAFDRLAWCYQNGMGVKADPKRAARYRDKAVALGNGDAMVMLANQKLQEKHEAEAIKLYQEAAEHGSANAIFALGQMYLHGQYVSQDTPKAISFFRRAADLNHPRALYFLSVLTVNRTAGAPSLDEAIDFAKRSAALGDKDAPAIRDRLERRRAKAETHPTAAAVPPPTS